MSKDGLNSRCKTCVREYDKRRNKERRSYIKHRSRKFREVKKDEATKNSRLWRQRNPEKYKAQTAVNHAVQRGKLIRKPCEKCGDLNTHGHHEDYSKPLDVIWLCPQCHKDRHNEINSK